MNSLVDFRSVEVGYAPGSPVLSEVTFSIEEGDFLGLVGPNGSGKTTLVRSLLGLVAPLEGSIRWREPRPNLGYVPQRNEADPSWPLTVEDTVTMGRYPMMGLMPGISKANRNRVEKALDRCELIPLREKSMDELSGGELQRVLIARALASEPELLILDEPTRAMDLSVTTRVLHLIRTLHEQEGITVIIVSHDLNIISSLTGRIALLHEGELIVGNRSEILNPDNLRTVYGDRFNEYLARETGLVLPDLDRNPGLNSP